MPTQTISNRLARSAYPRLPSSELRVLALLLATLPFWAACSSGGKKPEPLPSQTTTRVAPRLEPPPPLPPPVRQVSPTPSRVKVIELGGESEEPTTLAEASRLAKSRKRKEGPKEAVAVITDENLHEYAAGAAVIVLESAPAAPVPQLDSPPPAAEESGVRDEQFWRGRALELRMGWRRTLDSISDLELESAALRQQFYAEEDTYIRDNQLKPAWDRVLDRLDQLYDRASRYEEEVDAFVEEGRQQDALDGWLNQGWELEPSAEEKKRLDRYDTLNASEDPRTVEPVDIETLEDGEGP